MPDQEYQKRIKWEIVGIYIGGVRPPMLVRPVLRDPANPDKWFSLEDPETDIKQKALNYNEDTKDGYGGGSFLELPKPLKYQPYDVCVYLGKHFPDYTGDPVIQVYAAVYHIFEGYLAKDMILKTGEEKED